MNLEKRINETKEIIVEHLESDLLFNFASDVEAIQNELKSNSRNYLEIIEERLNILDDLNELCQIDDRFDSNHLLDQLTRVYVTFCFFGIMNLVTKKDPETLQFFNKNLH